MRSVLKGLYRGFVALCLCVFVCVGKVFVFLFCIFVCLRVCKEG